MKPSAPLFLVFNRHDFCQRWPDRDVHTSWELKLGRLMESLESEIYHPQVGCLWWKEVFNKKLGQEGNGSSDRGPPFSMPLQEHSSFWIEHMTKDAIWDMWRSLSEISVLDKEELDVSPR
jgi:hypothetical protein